jgi:prepilin-type N-terminal cleavage/methylation domain-containing protein
MRKNSGSAFTLIELLVVTVMLSIVCLAIYSTFASGAKIWQRVNRLDSNEDVNIFFDRFTSDVKNSFNFTGLDFTGKIDRFQLATLVTSPALGARTVGLAVYSYSEKSLSRSKSDYSQLYEETQVPSRHYLKGVDSCRFSYYKYDLDTKEYSWVEEWNKEGLPLAIRMELTVGGEENPMKFVKTESIPVSSKVKDEQK